MRSLLSDSLAAFRAHCIFLTACVALLCPQAGAGTPEFAVSFPTTVHPQPVTGRLFLMISRTNDPEVRLQGHWINGPQLFAMDVARMTPDQPVVIDSKAAGFPYSNLDQLPSGDYYVQAVLSLYTEFHRTDGRTVLAHMDQWEGQQFNLSPGNLFSRVSRIHLDPAASSRTILQLSEVIPPIVVPTDTQWVKYVKIQSKLLSRFWGRPIYLGAVVLLPKDYATESRRRYPVIYYQQGHFSLQAPFGFRTTESREKEWDRRERLKAGFETGFEFYQSWQSEQFPRAIAISFQHATPFADMSGVRNSANNGPYADAIMQELIPYLEEHFRIIHAPFARVLTGKASGGRDALALQLQYPDFFGGAWIFHPWAFMFSSFFNLNIYDNDNAFEVKPADVPEWARNPSGWFPLERYLARIGDGTPLVSMRQMSRHDAVIAGDGPGGEFGTDDAILGPVGADGYPRRLWNRRTGQIDHEVAGYWKEHGDLGYYTQQNWAAIGPLLVGKLHFYAGDMDHFQRNYGVHLFQKLLESLHDPDYGGSFEYGQLHADWQPMNNAALVKLMIRQVIEHAPPEVGATIQQP